MSKATVRSGFDAGVRSDKPALSNPRDKFLRLRSGQREAFVYFKSPVPLGATVTSATLRFYARGSSSGSRTLTATRVGASWKARRVNWNNRPGTTGSGATKAITGLSDGDVIDIDVTAHVQTIANGASNFGWKITTSATSVHNLYGLDSGNKPLLIVEWSDAPAAPTSLTPSGGVVSAAKPTLQFDYADVSGNTELAAVHVQVDPAQNGASPAFDSGEVATTTSEFRLADSAYAGLANAATTSWRVRVKDGAGLWSDWSEWAEFTRTDKPAVTITNPSGGIVQETTPPIIWSLAGTQSAFEVIVFDAAGKQLHSSLVQQGAATSYTIPPKVIVDGATYTVEVRAYDATANRQETPGDPTYASARATFVVQDDPGTSPVATLIASADGVTPWPTLTFTRATAPDSWTVYRNGKAVAQLVDPADTLQGGTTHVWTDYTAAPNRSHTYTVRAVVNGKQSPAGPSDDVTVEAAGIWIADPDRGLSVALWGDDDGQWASPDDASVYTPVGSSEVVRIVTGMRGLEGSLTGWLMDGFGRTFDDLEGSLYDLKEHPSATVRLVAGDVNIPVVIGDITVAPRPVTRAGRLRKAVSFAFWQTGDLPYTPRI